MRILIPADAATALVLRTGMKDVPSLEELKALVFAIPASHQIARPRFNVLPGNLAAAFNHAIGMGPFKKGAVNGAAMYLPVEESCLTLLTGILLSSIYIKISL
jgi:hypothetical protein